MRRRRPSIYTGLFPPLTDCRAYSALQHRCCCCVEQEYFSTISSYILWIDSGWFLCVISSFTVLTWFLFLERLLGTFSPEFRYRFSETLSALLIIQYLLMIINGSSSGSTQSNFKGHWLRLEMSTDRCAVRLRLRYFLVYFPKLWCSFRCRYSSNSICCAEWFVM